MMRFAINRIKIPREQDKFMRVPDFVEKCVGYVALYHSSDALSNDYDLEGTGFFVSLPVSPRPAISWFYFVTAKHVVEHLNYPDTWFLVNKRGGGIKRLASGPKWFYHPTDKNADVAIMPFTIDPEDDILNIPISMFLTKGALSHNNIGVGDDVFFPGLFTFAPGTGRNLPIVRHGSIAMLPDEEIQVDSGFAHVHLIEARSIGGISGSPVFTRGTVAINVSVKSGWYPDALHGLSSHLHLLGMARGHWDIKEEDINRYDATHDRQRGVNMGLAMVTPAYKIIETINHPELVSFRKSEEDKIRAAISPEGDAV